METNEPAPSGGRACLHCGEAIPAERRSNAKCCSTRCGNARNLKNWKAANPERKRELDNASVKRVKEKDPEGWATKQNARAAEYKARKKEEDPEEYSRKNVANVAQWRKSLGEGLSAKRHEQYVGVDLLGVRRSMLSGAKGRAERKGLPFNIDLDDIQIPSVCPVLGIPIKVGAGRVQHGSPSLDRIIPALGYTKSNVEVISHRANSLKNNATVQEMRTLADYYEAKMSSHTFLVPPAR